MNDQQIDRLIERRNKLTNRRDGLTDSKIIDAIDARLRSVPPGQNNAIDLLLGRPCAVLPPRVVMVQHVDGTREIAPDFAATRWSTDAERAAWKAEAAAEIAPLAEEMVQAWRDQTDDHDAFNCVERAAESIEESPRDWLDMRGDLGL